MGDDYLRGRLKDAGEMRRKGAVETYGVIMSIVNAIISLSIGYCVINSFFSIFGSGVFMYEIVYSPSLTLSFFDVFRSSVLLLSLLGASYGVGRGVNIFFTWVVSEFLYIVLLFSVRISRVIALKRRILGENPPHWKSEAWDWGEILVVLVIATYLLWVVWGMRGGV